MKTYRMMVKCTQKVNKVAKMEEWCWEVDDGSIQNSFQNSNMIDKIMENQNYKVFK